ncbi:MAG: hypothetical protein Q7R76_06395 [Candidatus Woesearchaeota archaeon]|nr:hypothetical protein [Candidatus Woesearchaeota archaeon]
MAEAVTTEELYTELKAIRKDVSYIKEHLDTALTGDEEEALAEAEKEYLTGKSVSLKHY